MELVLNERGPVMNVNSVISSRNSVNENRNCR